MQGKARRKDAMRVRVHKYEKKRRKGGTHRNERLDARLGVEKGEFVETPVDHVDHSVDRHRGLRDRSRHDHFARVSGRAVKDFHLVLLGQTRVERQHPQPG
jgi:hypothetical protein